MRAIEYPGQGVTLYRSVLPNGLSVYVVPKPGWRKCRAAFVTSFGGADRRFTLEGERCDTPAGVAHYLEHKMFDMPYGSVDSVFAARGADSNAYTSYAVTSYHFTCTDRFEDDLRTLLAFVSTPYFTPETVEKERGIIGQEIAQGEDDPDWAVYQDCLRLLFGGQHPLGDDVAGTAASIAEITTETLYACHRAFYIPANMALCVAGDVDPEAVERIAREELPEEPAPLPVRDWGPDPGLEPVERRSQRVMDVAAPLFCAGIKLGPAATGPEALRERLTAELALRCLWGKSAPAYLALYEKGLLNNSFYFELDHAAGQSYVTLSGESADPEAALAALTAAAEKPVDPAFFLRQKKAAYGGFIRRLDDFYELTESLAEGCFGGFDPLRAPETLDAIGCDDVSAWAAEHLAAGRFALSIIRPKEEQA